MAYPSVSNTFANSTTADATAVNTNFTDLINGASDGTKDYSINALTCAGAATLNGNVTLGNSSSDDITVTGSLASSIAIKTTQSYDIGAATLGLRSLYLGSADSAARSTRIIGGTVAASWTMTLPTSGGTSGYRLQTDGSGTTSWVGPIAAGYYDTSNTVSVNGATKLTFAAAGLMFDDNSMFGDSDDKWTVPVAGLYRLAASIRVAAGSVAISAYFYKNGTGNVVPGMVSAATTANGSNLTVMSLTETVSLAANDYIQLYGSSGGAINFQDRTFSITKIN